MFVLTLFRIIKLITDANEWLSFTWEFIKWTLTGTLKSTQVQHTHTHGECDAQWLETNGDQKIWNGGSRQRSGRAEGPWLITQGNTWKHNFLASPRLKWCHLFYSLNSIASLKLVLSILMRSKDVTSNVNAWIGADRERKVGGHMYTHTHTHTVVEKENRKWLKVLKSMI